MKQPHKLDAKDSDILVRRPKKNADHVRAYWDAQRKQSAKPLDIEHTPPPDTVRSGSDTS